MNDPDTPYSYILLLAQSETERILIDRLAALGVHVERGVTMIAFGQDERGITATLSHADGPEESVQADWLVGCDGAHSAVRHGLGYVRGCRVRGPLLVGGHPCAVVARRRRSTRIPRHARPPFRLPHRRAGSLSPDRAAVQAPRAVTANPTLTDMQALMDIVGPAGTVLSDPVWLTAFRLHHRKVTRFRVGRVFLAGDAAHIHSPAGGQGMNTGIQDAYNLAWKLALVIRGEADTALLDTYDTERGAVAAQVLRQTDLMFRAMTVQSAPLRAIRNRLLPFLISRRILIRRMQRTLGELDIRYRRSAIIAEAGRRNGPHAGMRAPNAPLVASPSGSATTLWNVCRDDKPLRHTLLLFSGPTVCDDFLRLAAIRQMVRERYGYIVAVHLLAASTEQPWDGPRYDDPRLIAHRRYGVTAPALALIRPDGYIGFRSQPANGNALRDYLDRIFTRHEATHERETGAAFGAHPTAE